MLVFYLSKYLCMHTHGRVYAHECDRCSQRPQVLGLSRDGIMGEGVTGRAGVESVALEVIVPCANQLSELLNSEPQNFRV